MKVSRRQLKQFALFTATIMIFSSCNRGYGCPMSDFSLTESLIDLATNALHILF